MPLGYLVWLVFGVVVGLVWAMRLVEAASILRQRFILHSGSSDAPPNPAPRVSVLVAAKDEQDNIETCISTLLQQNYPNFEIIAIDDRSTDRTLEILRGMAQPAGDKLHVVTVTQLRDGWFGKNNAMREGVSVASGDWLCFTDADCRQTSTNTLTVAMRKVLDEKIDFLSITPLLDTKVAWERVTQPVCAFVMVFCFLPRDVNDPSKKTAYANGAFMLMDRNCYEAIGGHERVRTEVNEDIVMARIAKEMGFGLHVAENDDLYHTRMYRTMGEAWRGWSRIFYGCLQSLTRLLVTCGVLVVFCIGPWLGLLVTVAGRDSAPAGSTALWSMVAGIWAVGLVLEQAAWWRVYGILRMRPAWSLAYPVGALAVLGMLIHAMLKATGATTTTWRGTTYREGADGRHRPLV